MYQSISMYLSIPTVFLSAYLARVLLGCCGRRGRALLNLVNPEGGDDGCLYGYISMYLAISTVSLCAAAPG